MPTDYDTLVKIFVSLYGMPLAQAQAAAAQMVAQNNLSPQATPQTSLSVPQPAAEDAALSRMQQYSQMLDAKKPPQPLGEKTSDISSGMVSGRRKY